MGLIQSISYFLVSYFLYRSVKVRLLHAVGVDAHIAAAEGCQDISAAFVP
jgi:hypothetical protein